MARLCRSDRKRSPRYRAMRGRRFAEVDHAQPPNRRVFFTRSSAGAWNPAAQSNVSRLATDPVDAAACVDKPCLCLCFGTLSHTTYSRPLRFTILHASHRRLIAERTCAVTESARVRGGGSGARSRTDEAKRARTRDPARMGLARRNDGTRRDARRPSGGVRVANAPSSRPSRRRVDPGRGVDTGRASFGLWARAERRGVAQETALQSNLDRFRVFIRLMTARVRATAGQRLCQSPEGNLLLFSSHALTIGFEIHTRPRVDVVDGTRANVRCEAMARYATPHADVRKNPARLAPSASPTSRSHRR